MLILLMVNGSKILLILKFLLVLANILLMLTWLRSSPSQQGVTANGSTGCLDLLEKHIYSRKI